MHNSFGIGSSLLLYGIIILLNFFGITHFGKEEIFSIVLIFFGLITFVKSFDKLKRSGLFITSVLMNLGIIYYVLTNYEILDWYNVVTPSLFYILGTGLLVLFIENTSEKTFLVGSCFLLLLSVASVLLSSKVGFIDFMDRVILMFYNIWSLLFILFGIMLMTGRRLKDLSSGISGSGNTTE